MILGEAQTAPGMTEVGMWVLIAALVISGLLNLVMLVKFLRDDPEKRIVTMSPEALTRSEFEAARIERDKEINKIIASLDRHIEINRQEHEGIFKKIGGVERGAREDLRQAMDRQDVSRRGIHDQMNNILTAIGELRGRRD